MYICLKYTHAAHIQNHFLCPGSKVRKLDSSSLFHDFPRPTEGPQHHTFPGLLCLVIYIGTPAQSQRMENNLVICEKAKPP